MKRRLKRSAIGFVGGIVVIVGIVMIPYPGPGWLVVFAGLTILATEFTWAERLLGYAHGKYDAWNKWVTGQNTAIRILFWVMTVGIVIVTLWLLDTYGYINGLLHLRFDWLRSPLPIFHQ
jgi:uncharacterized protein (TIGR02611 family)